MTGLRALLRKELREQWRTGRLPVVAVIFLLFGFASPLLAKYTPDLLTSLGNDVQIIMPEPTARDAVDQLLKNLGQTAGPFAAILLAMGIVAREKERGTAAMVLTKPATRPAFLAAKFAALAATLAAGVALAGVAAYAYTALLFETPPVGGYAACCALLLLEIACYAAITFLGSTLARSSAPAAGLGLAAFIVSAIVAALPRAGRLMPQGLFDPARSLALGDGATGLATPLVAALVLVAVALALAWLSFRGQEIGGQ